MNANELMIGDWVVRDSHKNTPQQVIGIGDKGVTLKLEGGWCGEAIDLIEPIPLTTEILEKSGFEPIHQDAGEPYYWQFFDKEEGHVINAFRRIYRGLCIECSNATTEASANKQCEYVHELQHVLRLAGINKEIVL